VDAGEVEVLLLVLHPLPHGCTLSNVILGPAEGVCSHHQLPAIWQSGPSLFRE